MGYSSPIVDGERIYQIDNSSHLKAFDISTGKELWELSLGSSQKAPPVFADGKIYVGTDSGEFFIVRPGATEGEVLSKVEMPLSKDSCCGSEGTSEQIYAGVAVSRGRIFMVSSDAVYALGPKQPKSSLWVCAGRACTAWQRHTLPGAGGANRTRCQAGAASEFQS